MWFTQFVVILALICCLTCKVSATYVRHDPDWFATIPIPSRECSTDFKGKFAAGMHDIRFVHNVPIPDYADYLNTAAQGIANSFLNDFTFNYIPNYQYGESIYTKSVGDPTRQVREIEVKFKDVVHHTDQEANYLYYGGEPPADNYHSDGWAQYAQLVWKETQHMGVGCSAGYNERTQMAVVFVVVLYDPKGLVPGRFGYNVHPYLGGTKLKYPMNSCPDFFQQTFVRRFNEDMFMYYDAPGFELNQTLLPLAQNEANRLIDLGEHANVESSYTSDYGTLVQFYDNNLSWLNEFFPRFPLEYYWNMKKPAYFAKNGTLLKYTIEMWKEPMQIGLGCATKYVGGKPYFYFVVKFTIPELCDNL